MLKLQNKIDQRVGNTLQLSSSNQDQSPINLFSSLKITQISQVGSLQSLFQFQLYLYHGPIWNMIKPLVIHEIKDPKNFIYNSIRRAAKRLAKYEIDLLGKRRRLVNRETILSMLEIINQVQKEIIDRGLILNQECQLFSFKKNLLRFSLWENSLAQEQICELIKKMKQINLKLRCLSIFKTKSRKNWKMSEKALQLITSFDNIIVQTQLRPQLCKKQPSSVLIEDCRQNITEEQSAGISEWNIDQLQSLFIQAEKENWEDEKSLEEVVNQILNIKNLQTNELKLLN